MGVVHVHRFGNESDATRRSFFWYQNWRWPGWIGRSPRSAARLRASISDHEPGRSGLSAPNSHDQASTALVPVAAVALCCAVHRFVVRACEWDQLGSMASPVARHPRRHAPVAKQRAQKTSPLARPDLALEANCPHVAKFWRLGLCSVCSFVPVLRVLASPSATPECASGK